MNRIPPKAPRKAPAPPITPARVPFNRTNIQTAPGAPTKPLNSGIESAGCIKPKCLFY